MGLSTSAGVLLCGPPGCGKTLMAKALAREANVSFIAIKGPEILNKYVGESEKAIRLLFYRARISQPCIIFFDEIDSLCPKRGTSDSSSTERIVNQLLTELDGIEARKQVQIIAATNRPDILDEALLRPGRIDKKLYLNLPNAEERFDIIKAQTRKMPLEQDVNLKEISDQIQGFSGADIGSLVREAGTQAMKDGLKIVKAKHFQKALTIIKPSSSNQFINM